MWFITEIFLDALSCMLHLRLASFFVERCCCALACLFLVCFVSLDFPWSMDCLSFRGLACRGARLGWRAGRGQNLVLTWLCFAWFLRFLIDVVVVFDASGEARISFSLDFILLDFCVFGRSLIVFLRLARTEFRFDIAWFSLIFVIGRCFVLLYRLAIVVLYWLCFVSLSYWSCAFVLARTEFRFDMAWFLLWGVVLFFCIVSLSCYLFRETRRRDDTFLT